MSLPLTGITVIALEQAVAGPFATRHLADLGARVIKVERQGSGDFARGYDNAVNGMSSYFVWLNRGKESITLDIKAEQDRQILDSMLARADVLVQNLAPGAIARLGLSEQYLRSRYPRLISCSICGYGSEGPYRDKKAYDLLVQCETGLLSVTGTPEQPTKVGISIADISAGMYAFSEVLCALYARERTGTGTTFTVSMIDTLGEWMSQPYLYAAYGGTSPRRVGARHATIAPYGPYATAGGAYVFIGVQNEREWVRLCEQVLGRPELAIDPRFADNVSRVKNNDTLTAFIEGSLATMTAEDAVRCLDDAGIANARMRTLDEFSGHPQLQARARWVDVDSPAGAVRCLLPPMADSREQAVMGRVPALGEHSAALRAEFGGAANSWPGDDDNEC